MPAWRYLKAYVYSQYGGQIPEWNPPSPPPRLILDRRPSQVINLTHPSPLIATVYIPTYPASRFWVSYAIDTFSPTLPTSPVVPFYYFKLFVNGCHIVSWGCGEDENFEGKTMFGIFRSQNGSGTLEKRVLGFEDDECAKGLIELRIFRAEARQRVRIEHDTVPQTGGIGGEIVRAGNIVLVY